VPGPFTPTIPLQPKSRIATGVNNPTKEVFGYATSGSLADPTFGYPTWNFDLLSTVAFFALHAQYNGVLIADSDWSVFDSSTMTGLVNTAHAHGTRVVVTIVGPGDFTDQCDALYNADTTVLQLVNQVKAKGLDGVNIDYEGQIGTCINNNPALDQSNQTLLTNFARLMRAGLDGLGPGYYLSMATYSGSAAGTDGYFNIPNLNQYVDAFFVMAYDMDYANQDFPPLGCTGSLGLHCLSPVSPLGTYNYNDTVSMTQYSAVVGSGKVILGQPYYGRVACVASPVENASPISALTAVTYQEAIGVVSSPDVEAGTYAVHRDTNEPTGLDRWDTWYDLSLGCWREMYWEDYWAYGARYSLVNLMNLRGVGFWTLNYGGGAPELWDTIQNYFVKCAQGTIAANPATTVPAGSTVTFTAGSSGCLSPQYEFWIQYPNGAWYLTQGWGGPSFTWNTAGLAPGTYTVHSWANRTSSGWETYGSATITLTGCTTASLTPVNPTQPAGTVVNLTGTSGGGCPNPVYEFWIEYPDGKWHLQQGWGAATDNWDTTGLTPGVYVVHSWSNQQGAAQPWEAFGSTTVTLTGCTSASLSPSSTTQPSGSVIGLLASSAGGCPSPVYEYWVQYPGGSWHLAQPWGLAAFNWDTTGLVPGSYTVHAWANQQGAAPTLEAYASAAITLTGCSAAAISPSSTTQPAGSAVSLTASSTSCPNAQYEFWIQYPNGSWNLKQAWGAGTYTWDTTNLAPGAYTVHAWARNEGPTWEVVGSATVTLTGCTSASVTPPSGSAAAGATVSFSVSAATCPTPNYEFWLRDPSGTWHLVQPFGASNSWAWNTTGWAKGTYTLHVWANEQGADTTTFETIGSATFTLT